MEDAFAVLAGDEPDADVAMLAAQLGRIHFFAGDRPLASERIESALDIAEALSLPDVLSSALNTKSLILQHRPHEGEALLVKPCASPSRTTSSPRRCAPKQPARQARRRRQDRGAQAAHGGGTRSRTPSRGSLLGAAARGQLSKSSCSPATGTRRSRSARRFARAHRGCDRRQRDPQPRTDRDRAGGAGYARELLPEITSDFEAGDFQQRGRAVAAAVPERARRLAGAAPTDVVAGSVLAAELRTSCYGAAVRGTPPGTPSRPEITTPHSA